MSFKKIVGIIQILLSLVLVAIPTTALILTKRSEQQIKQNIAELITAGITNEVTSMLPDMVNIFQTAIIIILIISAIIALPLILQGIVNIKE